MLSACTALAGCGVVSTTVAVTGMAVGVATTAVGLTVDGAILVGKGVAKVGEMALEANAEPAPQEPINATPKH